MGSLWQRRSQPRFMARLGPVWWKDLVRKLHALGFEGPLHRGKHPYMVRGKIRVTIPNPHREQISVDLLSRILRQAEVMREEWETAE